MEKKLPNGPKYYITRSFLSSWKGIFKMPKPSGEKTRKDLVIIGKVLFSSDLLFSKDYILLLKITLKWLLITQGKYVPLLIHLLAMHLLKVSCLRSIRHSFRKSLWKYCEKWLPRPFRPWLILTTIFFRCWLRSIIFWSMT